MTKKTGVTNNTGLRCLGFERECENPPVPQRRFCHTCSTRKSRQKRRDQHQQTELERTAALEQVSALQAELVCRFPVSSFQLLIHFKSAWKRVACYLRCKELDVNRFCAQNGLTMTISSMNVPAMASFSNPDIANELDHVVKTILGPEPVRTQTYAHNSFLDESPEQSPLYDESVQHTQLPPLAPITERHASLASPPVVAHEDKMRKILDQIEQHHGEHFSKI
jgi:hypothetical protein